MRDAISWIGGLTGSLLDLGEVARSDPQPLDRELADLISSGAIRP